MALDFATGLGVLGSGAFTTGFGGWGATTTGFGAGFVTSTTMAGAAGAGWPAKQNAEQEALPSIDML